MSAVSVDVGGNLNATLTVRIIGQRRRAARNWLGIRLIRLAAAVLGVSVVIEQADA